jgi:hypothetical protein
MNSRPVEILTEWKPTILSEANVAATDPAIPKRRSLRVMKQLDQLGPSEEERQPVSVSVRFFGGRGRNRTYNLSVKSRMAKVGASTESTG